MEGAWGQSHHKAGNWSPLRKGWTFPIVCYDVTNCVSPLEVPSVFLQRRVLSQNFSDIAAFELNCFSLPLFFFFRLLRKADFKIQWKWMAPRISRNPMTTTSSSLEGVLEDWQPPRQGSLCVLGYGESSQILTTVICMFLELPLFNFYIGVALIILVYEILRY